MSKIITVLLALAAATQAAEPRFEAGVVKRYDAQATKYLGCFLGPGDLQYNCSGSVPALAAEALNFDEYQFKEAGPVYTIIAKLTKPAARQQIDEMLGRFLRETMGVAYHLEKRPIKGEFLNVASPALLKNLAVSNDPIPVAVAFRYPGIPIHRSWQYVEQRETSTHVPYYKVRCVNITFRLFAQLLHEKYATPVIDETGLKSRFNVEFTKDQNDDGGINHSEVVSILKRWGISLTPRKGLMDFIVVDRVTDESKFLE